LATESAVGVVDQTAAGVGNTKAVDTTTVTTPAGATQYRQAVVVADPQAPGGVAPVDPQLGLAVNITNPTVAVSIVADDTAPMPVYGQVQATLRGANTGLPIDTGQAPMASSLPVAIARDQTPVPVALPAGPLPVNDLASAAIGTAQDATTYGDGSGSVVAQLRGINAQLGALLALFAGSIGTANSQAVTIINDSSIPVPVAGQVNVALAGAQSGIPIDVGQKPMALSLPVAIAPDQPPVAVTLPAGPVPVATADGAVTTLGTTQDAALYGSSGGSIAAQLRGINDQLATLTMAVFSLVDMNSAQLAALNNLAVQLGAAAVPAPAAYPLSPTSFN
jgi:hypothetical protein